MSAPQIQPQRPRSESSSLEEDDRKSTLASDEKGQVEGQPTPIRVLGEDGEYVHEEDAPIGAVGLPWSKKAPALALILLFVLGSNWAGSALGPLKSTLRKELKIKNAQYGVLASADSLINSILPILTGIAIDYYGPVKGALAASTFILVGQVLTSVGATIENFSCMVVGQIILGFGSTAIETSQSKLYSHWFLGQFGSGVGIIGFVYGLDIGIGRVYNLAGKLSAVPIMESTGNFIWSFWVPACMCALSLGVVVVYALFERTIPEKNRPRTGAMMAARRAERGIVDEKITLKTRWQYMVYSILAIPACFWIITITQLLQAGTVSAYNSNLADMVEQTRGTTKLTAGYTSSLSQVMPIVLTPLLGLAFDRFGRRMYLVTATAALWVLVFSLLGFTSVHPMVPTILGSLALSTNALPFICSIPLLVPNQANLGTAFGIWKAFNSSGSTILDVATGAIQDLTPKGPRQYSNVFYLLIALKSVDVFYGLGYHLFDRRYLGGILRASERDRVKIERTESASNRSAGLRSPMRKVTWFGVFVAAALIVVAYVVYIVYALGT